MPYTVFDGQTALKTVVIDQQTFPLDEQTHGAGWRSLGIYAIHGGTLIVELDGTHCKSPPKPIGRGAVADAIRVAARAEAADSAPNNPRMQKESP